MYVKSFAPFRNISKISHKRVILFHTRFSKGSNYLPLLYLCYTQQDRQCTDNVTFRRVRKTIVACKSNKLHISVCVCVRTCVRTCMRVWCGSMGTGVCLRRACSLTNPVCNAPPYCHLRALWLHHIFRHYLINGTIFKKKKLTEHKCVF